MNKTDSLTELPDMEYKFAFSKAGKITRRTYSGYFLYKMPITKIQCCIDKHFAFLNGDSAQHLDISTIQIHRKIAYLRFTLLEFPLFWKDSDLGYELMDHNIIDDVYDKVITFENEWMTKVWGKSEDSKA